MTPGMMVAGGVGLLVVCGVVAVIANRKTLMPSVFGTGGTVGDKTLQEILDDLKAGAALSLPARQTIVSQVMLLDSMGDVFPDPADRQKAHELCAAQIALYSKIPAASIAAAQQNTATLKQAAPATLPAGA